MRLKDMVCVVPGAASGIGEEIAAPFARKGVRIVASLVAFEFAKWTKLLAIRIASPACARRHERAARA